MRTPLAGMTAALEILRSAAETDALSAQAHRVLVSGVSRQARLVDDVLDVARLSTGNGDLCLRPLDIRALIAELQPAFVLQAGHKDLHLGGRHAGGGGRRGRRP